MQRFVSWEIWGHRGNRKKCKLIGEGHAVIYEGETIHQRIRTWTLGNMCLICPHRLFSSSMFGISDLLFITRFTLMKGIHPAVVMISCIAWWLNRKVAKYHRGPKPSKSYHSLAFKYVNLLLQLDEDQTTVSNSILVTWCFFSAQFYKLKWDTWPKHSITGALVVFGEKCEGRRLLLLLHEHHQKHLFWFPQKTESITWRSLYMMQEKNNLSWVRLPSSPMEL